MTDWRNETFGPTPELVGGKTAVPLPDYKALAADALAMLERCEWLGDTSDGKRLCPVCEYTEWHEVGCAYAALLARAGEELK